MANKKATHVGKNEGVSKSGKRFWLKKILSAGTVTSIAAVVVRSLHLKGDTQRLRNLQARKNGFSDSLRDFSSLDREIGAMSLRHAPLASFISIGTEDWMSLLDDNTLLSEISIPGTHDSAASIGVPLCDTQNWSLSDQLKSGRFDDVLKVVSSFLSDHSGEIIIMRISNEFQPSHDAFSFEQIWNRYVENPAYGNLFMPRLSDIPVLGDVRGRIIVVSNELGPRPNYGMQFFGGPLTSIQDVFKLNSDTDVALKVELIFSQMEGAPLQHDKLTFNHLSGTGLPDLRFTPQAVAITTNTATYDLMGYGNFKREVGILIADYPGEGLISRILLNNFGEESLSKLRTQNQFRLYSAINCEEGKQIGLLDYPFRGGSMTTDMSAKPNMTDNLVRSVLLPGPVEAGTRIFVGGLSKLLGKSDSTIITIVQNIPEGGFICIENLRESVAEVAFVQTYQEYAEIKANLPSSVYIERPTAETAAFTITMTRELHWTGKFCVGKSSDGARGGPITGILRSKIKGCQTLSQSKTKICTGESSYWTSFISLLRKSNQCRQGYFVGQTKCFGAKCSRMMLRCYKTSSQCSLDARGATSVRKIRYGDEDFCPFGSILTGIECQRPACIVLTAFCTKLTYNG